MDFGGRRPKNPKHWVDCRRTNDKYRFFFRFELDGILRKHVTKTKRKGALNKHIIILV